MRIVSLALLLYAFWLLLSGHYVPWLLVVGALCTALIVVLSYRMGLIDEEGLPLQVARRAVGYWVWLIWQIAMSVLKVSRIILHPALPISPTVIRIKASEKTAVGITTYANSITLTPGTISVAVSQGDREILVHALTKDNADDLLSGEMDRRVAAIEAPT